MQYAWCPVQCPSYDLPLLIEAGVISRECGRENAGLCVSVACLSFIGPEDWPRVSCPLPGPEAEK